MREHKYRAWDKENKKMYYSKGHNSMNDGDYCIHSLFIFELPRHQHIFNYDLMQYTGLKDKNGKEIYEGDIISDCFEHPDKEDNCHYLGPSKKGIIKWNISHAGFYIETDRWENDMYMTEITGPTTSHQIISEWIEIIGNIYENPELKEANQ